MGSKYSKHTAEVTNPIPFKRMKKYKNLFLKICTDENFQLAYKNAIKRKRHYAEVLEIELHRDEYLHNLAEEVRTKKYRVSEYTVFKLWSGEKWRNIYKLPMRDRIVLHAIMNYCEEIFRESFIADTFSSIKGRGIHRGLNRVKRAIKDDRYPYVLQLDIHHCYPSLDLEILKQKLFKKFKDKDLLLLFSVIIDSCEEGVPIGNYTSLYFNNFYFNDFDHWMKEVKHTKYYFRYCDDIVLFGETKGVLHTLLKDIKQYVHNLHVKLKPNYRIFPKEIGVNFLGYINRLKYRRIRKYTKQHFIEKVEKIDFQNLSKRNVSTLGSYWGIFLHGDCRHLWYCYTKYKTLYEINRDSKMANVEKYIPIILKWEVSITTRGDETLEHAFNRAKKVGFVNDPNDNGGATMIGVTIGTYRSYCRYKGKKTPSVQDLKNITYKEWRDIIHSMYWNKWNADQIEDQRTANMVVDWMWHSGASTIKKIQALLGVTADGIVGPKTIAAINKDDKINKKVYDARKDYFEAIVKRNPSQKKWLNGWMNRLNYVYTAG